MNFFYKKTTHTKSFVWVKSNVSLTASFKILKIDHVLNDYYRQWRVDIVRHVAIWANSRYAVNTVYE